METKPHPAGATIRITGEGFCDPRVKGKLRRLAKSLPQGAMLYYNTGCLTVSLEGTLSCTVMVDVDILMEGSIGEKYLVRSLYGQLQSELERVQGITQKEGGQQNGMVQEEKD